MPDPAPPDLSLLVLDSDEEAFLKAATNIDVLVFLGTRMRSPSG